MHIYTHSQQTILSDRALSPVVCCECRQLELRFPSIRCQPGGSACACCVWRSSARACVRSSVFIRCGGAVVWGTGSIRSRSVVWRHGTNTAPPYSEAIARAFSSYTGW